MPPFVSLRPFATVIPISRPSSARWTEFQRPLTTQLQELRLRFIRLAKTVDHTAIRSLTRTEIMPTNLTYYPHEYGSWEHLSVLLKGKRTQTRHIIPILT